jgi:hypothetical protein
LELTVGVYDQQSLNEFSQSLATFLHVNQNQPQLKSQTSNQSNWSDSDRPNNGESERNQSMSTSQSERLEKEEVHRNDRAPELSDDKSDECEKPRNEKCLSTLDCDLKRNERCVQHDLEEQQFYRRLQQITSNLVLFSPLLLQPIAGSLNESNGAGNAWLDELAEGNCGCSAPAFARNPKNNRCELLRPLQLSLRLRFEQPKFDRNEPIDEQVLRSLASVVKASGSLQDSLHHFRLLKVFALRSSTRNDKSRRIKRRLPSSITTDSAEAKPSSTETPSLPTNLPVFGVSGLLMVYESQFNNDFALQFSNQFCVTLNQLRLRSRLQQLLNGAVTADRFVLHEPSLTNQTSNQIKRIMKKRNPSNEERQTLFDDSLPEVNITQIRPHSDICALEKAAMLSMLGRVETVSSGYAETGSALVQLRPHVNLSESSVFLFSRLSYCEPDHAACQSRSSSVYGYVCVCQPGLMDLGAWPSRYPAEHCGVRCPLNYCSNGGFCHVRGASPAGLHVPPELTAQQQYLSTAARAASGPERSGLAAQLAATLLRYARQQQRYYAAIYSVQQRFARLFAALPGRSNDDREWTQHAIGQTTESSPKSSYTQTLRGNLYCTCSGWHIGARCQYSGLLVLCVLLVVVALLTFLLACAFSLLCVSSGSSAHLGAIDSIEKLQDISSDSNDSTRVASPAVGHEEDAVVRSHGTMNANDSSSAARDTPEVRPTEHYRILPAITKPEAAVIHAAVKSSVSVPIVSSSIGSPINVTDNSAGLDSSVLAASTTTKTTRATTDIDTPIRFYAVERPLLKSVSNNRSQGQSKAIPFKTNVVFAPLPTCCSAPPITGRTSVSPDVPSIDLKTDQMELKSEPKATIEAKSRCLPLPVDSKKAVLSQAQQTDSFDSVSGDRVPPRGVRSSTQNASAQVQLSRSALPPVERHFVTITADRNNNKHHAPPADETRRQLVDVNQVVPTNRPTTQLSTLDATSLSQSDQWTDAAILADKARSDQYKHTQITWF